MSEKISDCLGISEKTWDETEKIAEDLLNSEEKISEALLKSAEKIKSEEFGENNWETSLFEKKIMIAAYVLGIHQGRSTTFRNLEENPEIIFAMLMKNKRRE